MEKHAHNQNELTRNQTLVMGCLERADQPMSAYSLLDALRDDGFKAPLQVYRALERLVEIGLVHRLESLNAFVACRHEGCDAHEAVAFTICEICGRTAEIADGELIRRLKTIAKQSGFQLAKLTVELRGTCAECLQKQHA